MFRLTIWRYRVKWSHIPDTGVMNLWNKIHFQNRLHETFWLPVLFYEGRLTVGNEMNRLTPRIHLFFISNILIFIQIIQHIDYLEKNLFLRMRKTMTNSICMNRVHSETEFHVHYIHIYWHHSYTYSIHNPYT